jgi:hypothetical protein
MWNGKDPNENFGSEMKKTSAGKQGAMQQMPGKGGQNQNPQQMGQMGADMAKNPGASMLPTAMLGGARRFMGRSGS